MLITEIEESPRILIVDRKVSGPTQTIQKTLSASGADVNVSNKLPRDLGRFDSIFFVHTSPKSVPEKKSHAQKWYFVYMGQESRALLLATYVRHVHMGAAKIVNLPSTASKKDIETMLWFLFSKSRERYLNLESHGTKKPLPQSISKRVRIFFTPRVLVVTTASFILLLHVVLLPLQYGAFYLLNSQNVLASPTASTAALVYQIARPTYSFFGLALLPDRMNDINTRLARIPTTKTEIKNTARQAQLLGEKKYKSTSDTRFLKESLQKLSRELTLLEDDASAISDKLPNFPADMERFKKEYDSSQGTTHQARLLAQATLEYIAQGLPIPATLLTKLQQVVSSL